MFIPFSDIFLRLMRKTVKCGVNGIIIALPAPELIKEIDNKIIRLNSRFT